MKSPLATTSRRSPIPVNGRVAVLLLGATSLFLALPLAAEPGTTSRSVINGVSEEPAPAMVARGGILAVLGSGLSAETLQAEGPSLPVALGDPPTEVLVNGVAAPLFLVSPERIRAQVPWETEPGRAAVIVRHGDWTSQPMPVIIAEAAPNLFVHEGSRTLIAQGETASQQGTPNLFPGAQRNLLEASDAVTPHQTVTIFAAGVGETEPPAVTGMAGSGTEAVPSLAQQAYLGGLPARVVSARLSEELVGVYELTVEVPEMVDSGEVLHWVSGTARGSGLLGAAGPLKMRFRPVPEGVETISRIDMSDLNPHFLALSGPLDEVEFCYREVHLLDFRRDTASPLPGCLLPSQPLADDPSLYRPFERLANTQLLAALEVPADDFAGPGITDRVTLVDSSDSSVSTLAWPAGTDGLEAPPVGGARVRLLHAGSPNERSLLDREGSEELAVSGPVPLPDPLEAAGLSRVVAQPGAGNFSGGYRMRIMASGDVDSVGSARALLFGPDASVLADVPFPEGWSPLVPPARQNAQGAVLGTPLVAAAQGFGGDAALLVLARSADGSRDGAIAFRFERPGDPEAALPESLEVQASVLPFPSGTYAANCTPQVRWQRSPLTMGLAIAGSGSALSEFAKPFENQVCVADRLVLVTPATGEVRVVEAPAPLDVGAKGTYRGYLYFGEGGRQVAMQAPERIHVFDMASETFREVPLPEGVGVTLNFRTQQIPGQGRLLALATGGPLRTNRRGLSLPPFPGNQGLLVVDLAEGSASHLALPEEFQRLLQLPNTSPLSREGRRGFALLPEAGIAFARAMAPNQGPGQPGRSALLMWDLQSGEASEVPLPEGAHWVIQPQVAGGQGRGTPPPPALWDFNLKSSSFAFGVFSRERALIAVGVVGL